MKRGGIGLRGGQMEFIFFVRARQLRGDEVNAIQLEVIDFVETSSLQHALLVAGVDREAVQVGSLRNRLASESSSGLVKPN